MQDEKEREKQSSLTIQDFICPVIKGLLTDARPSKKIKTDGIEPDI